MKKKMIVIKMVIRMMVVMMMMKGKELSPMVGHKGIQVPGPTQGSGQGQPNEHSPHTLRKVSKKLAPIPPKVPYGQSGGVSDQSTGHPSPVSLSPTPPSTPSPYGLSCPQGYATMSSPGQPPQPGVTVHSLSSPPSLTGTLTKSRPAPKPRQRPSLPPPQPPTAPGLSSTSPQPMDHTLLDTMAPGESMSTGKPVPVATYHHLFFHTSFLASYFLPSVCEPSH
ncbi:hypothetical protein JZ751_027533 [Albula glossodonta]|uniref:Uncharacterized protein n=1 Tax=Albula glossodonta TaxID=121402 RepID=A0A8T2NG19_9TELE|nr:hypothetical protein JZ751_027533 [Albula glossodonta]